MDRFSFLSKFGFRVIPCWNNRKIPRMENWQTQATYDPKVVGNYGVLASGAPYGEGTIVVVDLDNHKANEESGVEFWEQNRLPSKTFTVSTPSGGKHLYEGMRIKPQYFEAFSFPLKKNTSLSSAIRILIHSLLVVA